MEDPLFFEEDDIPEPKQKRRGSAWEERWPYLLVEAIDRRHKTKHIWTGLTEAEFKELEKERYRGHPRFKILDIIKSPYLKTKWM